MADLRSETLKDMADLTAPPAVDLTTPHPLTKGMGREKLILAIGF